ncbi:MAG: L-histidine N(alpha)-methyltransferase [Gemmatimonadetes bacterium]|nr:L-histidine N(alpha)-methyltransferase [Gemmatimonadota bacterium]
MIPAAAQSRFRLIEGEQLQSESFAEAVEAGLSRDPKKLDCRFFYDETGSLLFERICELPEYYLTRSEREILVERSREIARRFPRDTILVELGSGSSAKTDLLISAWIAEHGSLRYEPIDISEEILRESSLQLLERHRRLTVHAIAGHFEDGLRRIESAESGAKLVIWLGSTIGNLTRSQAIAFLRNVRGSLSERDGLLIGIDLRKDVGILENAYNDAAGVTADFNLNLLDRINAELGGHFDRARFRHEAKFNSESGSIQMFLVSEESQEVAIDEIGRTFSFGAGERIHTENSHKYSIDEIDSLFHEARFALAERWFDSNGLFSLNLARPLP